MDIVEIGTCFGGNALTIMKSMPSSMLHIVDPFLPNYDPRDSLSRRFNEYATERNMTAEIFGCVISRDEDKIWMSLSPLP